jgi:hypothetical protein
VNSPSHPGISANWQTALARVEFTLPSRAFEAKLIAACDGTRPVASLKTSTHFAAVSGLLAMASNSVVEQASGLFSALSGNAEMLRYEWLHFQTFAQVPTTRSNWSRLQQLMLE